MNNVEKHIGLLGLRVRDKVTGFHGVVSSISFDLYGCVQAVVTPPINQEGKKQEGHWYDVARLEVLENKPVMAVPGYFGSGPQAQGKQGAADKPRMMKP